MKNKKLILLPVITLLFTPVMALSATGCGGLIEDIFGGGGEEGQVDATLYHLTLSSNIELSNEQKAELKAVYGYGEVGETVVEGTRDEDEIQALKDAGATDADIEKAGKRQNDGSYYFFDSDPIYLVAPAINGYKLDGFYNKSTGLLEDRATTLKNPDGSLSRSRWNMAQEDIELEARYNKRSYTISFDNMEDDETNPNQAITKYCYLDDGEVTLAPATTTNKLKTFLYWEYQDTASPLMEAPWIKLEGGKLPTDYDEEYMRIHAVFSHKQLKIDFDFVEYIDPETSNPLAYDDVIESMSISSNIGTVNGTPINPEGHGAPIDNTSEIYIDGVAGWANIFFTLKPGYQVFYFAINGVRNDIINASHMEDPYIGISIGDLKEDSTITFVLANYN